MGVGVGVGGGGFVEVGVGSGYGGGGGGGGGGGRGMIYQCFHWTHRGPVMHICVSRLMMIGPDYGLSPERHQAIIWIKQ